MVWVIVKLLFRLFLFIAISGFFISFYPARSLADEPQNYLRFSCMPKIPSFQVVTVFSYKVLDQDIRDLYGLTRAKDILCDLNGQKITLSYELMNKYKISSSGYPALRSGETETYEVTVLINNQPMWTVDFFGGSKNTVPHVISYNGSELSACHGYDEQKCEIISRLSK